MTMICAGPERVACGDGPPAVPSRMSREAGGAARTSGASAAELRVVRNARRSTQPILRCSTSAAFAAGLSGGVGRDGRLVAQLPGDRPGLAVQERPRRVALGRRHHAPQLFTKVAKLFGQDSKFRLDVVFVLPGTHEYCRHIAGLMPSKMPKYAEIVTAVCLMSGQMVSAQPSLEPAEVARPARGSVSGRMTGIPSGFPADGRRGRVLPRVAADHLQSGRGAPEPVDESGAVAPDDASAAAALSAGLFTLPIALRGSAGTMSTSRGIL